MFDELENGVELLMLKLQVSLAKLVPSGIQCGVQSCVKEGFFFYVDSCIHDSTCDESHSNPSAFMIFCRVKFIGELATKER